MNQQKTTIFLFVVALLFMVGSTCLFIVDETENAIVLQFGKPVKVHKEAGLKVKLPFPFQEVKSYDKRILNVDPDPRPVILSSDTNNPLVRQITKEISTEKVIENDEDAQIADVNGGAPIVVDTFARYRITDPLQFLEQLGSEFNARAQIERVMESSTRDVLGQMTLADLLSERRVLIMEQIRDKVNAVMQPRGVEIVDVRIVRADLTNTLRTSTVNRMITERKEQATKTRSTGQERALEIKSTADKEREILIAEAQRDAQIIRGEGDKEAIKIYADSFNKDPDFYAFTRTMEAYRNTLAQPDTKLVVSPDSDFLRYLKDRK
jgi:membrane protease subunit HflC